MSEKRAIIVVSFGTTYIESLDTCIVPIEAAVAGAFDACAVHRAFTSVFVRGRLAESGIIVDGLPDVLERLCSEGYREVIIAPTHIIAGEEYRKKIVSVADAYRSRFDRLAVGRPLLPCEVDSSCSVDFKEVAQAIRTQIPPLSEGDAVVLLGHGSRCAEGSVYPCLQEAFDSSSDPVLVGVMEEGDALSLDYVMRQLGKRTAVQQIYLMPFLLVAGCHTAKDMKRWQARMEDAGYRVIPYLHGLGENAAIRALYIKRIREMMDEI